MVLIFPITLFLMKNFFSIILIPIQRSFRQAFLYKKKAVYLLDNILQKSDFHVEIPLVAGSRSDFFISSGVGDRDVFVDVKIYSPPTVIEIDQLGCEIVSRIGDSSGDFIISDRISTLLASSLKKTSYPPNYVLILGINDFPSPENLLRYRVYQEFLNKEVLPKLIKDNNLQINS